MDCRGRPMVDRGGIDAICEISNIEDLLRLHAGENVAAKYTVEETILLDQRDGACNDCSNKDDRRSVTRAFQDLCLPLEPHGSFGGDVRLLADPRQRDRSTPTVNKYETMQKQLKRLVGFFILRHSPIRRNYRNPSAASQIKINTISK